MNKDYLHSAWLCAKELDEGLETANAGLKRVLKDDTTGLIENFLEMIKISKTTSSKVIYYLQKAGVHELNRREDE